MIVVSNTSPIINLAAVSQLNLLHQLDGRIAIPTAVFHEIVVSGAGQPGAADVRASAWIAAQPVADQALVTSLLLDLDSGEAEAIALAVQVGADLLLLDERQGRRVAARPC